MNHMPSPRALDNSLFGLGKRAYFELAASLPHCQGLSSRRQSWRLSGASIPCRRIRWPCTSMVSPSITEAPPATSAKAGVASRHRATVSAWAPSCPCSPPRLSPWSTHAAACEPPHP